MKRLRSVRWMSTAALAMLLAVGMITTVWAQGSATKEPGKHKVDAKSESDGQSKSETKPSLIAVKFHADWCGFCKAMGSVYTELQAKFDQQPVLWLEFDLTREHQRKQSAYHAQALGLSQVWNEHGDKTGFILLIDADTHIVLRKLTSDQNLKQMGVELIDALKESPATQRKE